MVVSTPYKKVFKRNLGPICRFCKTIYIREAGDRFFYHEIADGGMWHYLYDGLDEGDLEIITIENGPGKRALVSINPTTMMAEWETPDE